MANIRRGSTIVGVFDDRDQLHDAISDLREAGFGDDQIGLLVHDPEGNLEQNREETEFQVAERPEQGALAGGVLGGLAGAAAVGMIPGIGPVLAAGALAGILGGATIGSSVGWIVGALGNLGLREEDADYYAREFHGGRHLLMVKTEDRQMQAADILRRNGAYDVDDRGGGGTEGYAPGGTGHDVGLAGDRTVDEGRTGSPYDARRASAGHDTTPPVTAADVGTSGVAAAGEGSPRTTFGEGAVGEVADGSISDSGAVREGSTGQSFGEASSGGGDIRPGSTGGGPTGLGSPGSTHDVGVRGPGTQGEARTRFERWEEVMPLHRREWERRHASGGERWEDRQEAYSFSWEHSMQPQYRDRDWSEVEPELRHDWEIHNPGTPWDQAMPSVREAWDRMGSTGSPTVEHDEGSEHRRADRAA